MIALDTNVLVRWITQDDPVQAARASAVLSGPVSISLTVLVEVGWVLCGKRLAFTKAMLADVLDRLVSTTTVTIEQERDVIWAIDRLRSGADFADMIHLVSAVTADTFATFDRRLARQAGIESPVPIETLA